MGLDIIMETRCSPCFYPPNITLQKNKDSRVLVVNRAICSILRSTRPMCGRARNHFSEKRRKKVILKWSRSTAPAVWFLFQRVVGTIENARRPLHRIHRQIVPSEVNRQLRWVVRVFLAVEIILSRRRKLVHWKSRNDRFEIFVISFHLIGDPMAWRIWLFFFLPFIILSR